MVSDLAREAFDLWSAPCRRNFWASVRSSWAKASWWKLVASDTWNRVCSKRAEDFQGLPQVGDFFRVQFRVRDMSWSETIWQCESRQDGAVVGKPIGGENCSWHTKRRMFTLKEVSFHNAHEHAKAFGVTSVR